MLAEVRTPSPSFLIALEHGYQPGLDELPAVAATLADAADEVLIVWDHQGVFLTYVVGDNHGVRIPREMARQLKGSVAIHNHPRGMPPSVRDTETVLRYGMQRLYVVTRVDDVIALARIDKRTGFRSHQGFKPSWDPIDPVDALVIPESPRVVAAQLAYGFLGDSLL